MEAGAAEGEFVLKALFENLDVAVWSIDATGKLEYQEGKVTKSEAAAAIGQNVFDVYPPDVVVGVRRALEGNRSRMVVELAPGEFWDSWYLPVHDEAGAVRGVIGMSVDISEAYRAQREVAAKLEVIERQQEVIRTLETPILEVWEGVVALPLVGVIDSSRAARVMSDLLATVVRTRAQFALMDLTGIDIVDTATANYLMNMVRAIGLLGASGVITGIRPNVAQTIISLGMDLSSMKTLGTLRQGLAYCIQQMAARGRDATII